MGRKEGDQNEKKQEIILLEETEKDADVSYTRKLNQCAHYS